MAEHQRIAIVSVYDKTGLLDLAKGLVNHNVRILASGGTARMIRESGFPVECVASSPAWFERNLPTMANSMLSSQGHLRHHQGPRDAGWPR
jgi:hypothetical protein